MVAEHIPPALEAILLVADDPLPPDLPPTVGRTVDEVVEMCTRSLIRRGRGSGAPRWVAAVIAIRPRPAAPYVERFVLDGQSSRLSAAALETLAVVAYKQPVSRNQIAVIRGVNVDGVMRTLQQRGYVDEVARDPGPGQAVLYGTTPTFLERLGLDSVSDLPPLGEFFPGTDVVEALERGLRVVPDEEVIAEAGTEAGSEAEADGADEPESS